MSKISGQPPMDNKNLLNWVGEMTALCQPENIHWCDGSEAEKEALTAEAMATGVLVKLNQKKLPGCYYHRSNPNDVARVEQCTFICTPMQEGSRADKQLDGTEGDVRQVRELCHGAMKGRTMYVVPYLMGPARFAAHQGRHRTHRLHLRRVEHAHHDAHGSGRLRPAR